MVFSETCKVIECDFINTGLSFINRVEVKFSDCQLLLLGNNCDFPIGLIICVCLIHLLIIIIWTDYI